jgi:hypothetical protein
MTTNDQDRKRIENLLLQLRPRIDLAESVRKKLCDITENCKIATAFAGQYLEDLERLPEDVQVVIGDIMRDGITLKLKCARLLALNRLEDLPVAKIEEEWEALCTSISLVGTTLAPSLGERMDAVL